jgi:hypothetical protein
MKFTHLLFLSTVTLTACGGTQPASQTPSAASSACPHAAPDSPGMMGGGMMKGDGMKGGGMMGGGMMGKGMGESCPMAVAGTTVRAEEVTGGSSLVFTTTGDVNELRRRVSTMAEMHDKHGAEGCPMMKMHEGASDAGTPPAAPSAAAPAAAPTPPPAAPTPAAPAAKPNAPAKPPLAPKPKG